MSKYEEYTDGEVLKLRHLHPEQSDEIAEYLLGKYKNMVRNKAREMYLIGGDTDDLIQEGMIGLFKAIRDYNPEKQASFYTFAQLCVDRQIYNAIQNSNRQKHQPLNTYVSLNDQQQDEAVMALWEQSPESIIIDRENAKQMQQKIYEKLSPFENIVLSLYLGEYDYVEIAKMLEKPQKSIDNALQRIKAKVKEQLFVKT